MTAISKRFHIMGRIDSELAEATRQRARFLHERSAAQIDRSVALLAESRKVLESADEILNGERSPMAADPKAND